MISVVTLTYKRKHLLEEAIQSFLLQDYSGMSEMVIINDCNEIEYKYNHPRVKIINCKERFSSIGKKLEYGMKQCSYDYVYMLDDDDLLTSFGLSLVDRYIKENPDYDIYKCAYHYFFLDNKFSGLAGNVNTGNCYNKQYINRINFPDHGQGYDWEITYNRGGRVYIGDFKKYSMIYRWGMNTTHVSGIPKTTNNKIYEIVDTKLNLDVDGVLRPSFLNNYYSQLDC